MEAVLQSGQIDVVAYRDAGPEFVAWGQGDGVRVDVDDDQARGAAGDADPGGRVRGPPCVDQGPVGGGGMESVAPATVGNAGAVAVVVTRLGTSAAVGSWGFASRSQGVDRPARLRAPVSDGAWVRAWRCRVNDVLGTAVGPLQSLATQQVRACALGEKRLKRLKFEIGWAIQ